MDHSPEFLKLVGEARKTVQEIGIAQLQARLAKGEKFLLIDVREDNEWERGRIPGARHLGRGILERDIEKAVPAKATELVLYCGGGFRSALAGENLRKMGYTKVLSVWGGYKGWVDAGGAIEK